MKVNGHVLLGARKARGWSQQVLGDKVGVTAEFISLVERGKREVTPEKLVEIAKALGIEASVLLRGEDTPTTEG